ncbi:helix-turn-helix transcriptional regulator [Wenjunlia vitaminophila]|uniref:helix-turn-helix transcriptional regulator n=1 Tax=Wenjunlia vitaminophila TaxID=76728 RepID=UPI0003A78E35|nr:WYL domain-containing protein [Wenjunlia vitaminophila]
MRADRLISLLLLLQNRGRMTAPELASELEVSVRTVYRDVEALGASGIPVHAERGPEGGYRLREGFRTRLTGLTDAEAAALFLTGTSGPARDLGLDTVLATAQLKLQAALPAELANRTRQVQDRFHLDAPGWFRDADPVPFLGPVAEAVWEQRVLRTHYRAWRGEGWRELHPLGMVLKSGIWYLVAQGDSGIRTYRVSRLLAVEATGDTFERPAGFDLAAHWEEFSQRLGAARYRGTARLRLSPRGQKLLPMCFGAVGTRALDTAGTPDDGGWVEVTMAVETTNVAVGDLLRLGTEAEVLAPPELRRAVADTVAGLAARYGAVDAPGGRHHGADGHASGGHTSDGLASEGHASGGRVSGGHLSDGHVSSRP